MKVDPMDELALLIELEYEQQIPISEYHWNYPREPERSDEPTS